MHHSGYIGGRRGGNGGQGSTVTKQKGDEPKSRWNDPVSPKGRPTLCRLDHYHNLKGRWRRLPSSPRVVHLLNGNVGCLVSCVAEGVTATAHELHCFDDALFRRRLVTSGWSYICGAQLLIWHCCQKGTVVGCGVGDPCLHRLLQLLVSYSIDREAGRFVGTGLKTGRQENAFRIKKVLRQLGTTKACCRQAALEHLVIMTACPEKDTETMEGKNERRGR